MGIGKDKGKGKDSFGDLIVYVATLFLLEDWYKDFKGILERKVGYLEDKALINGKQKFYPSTWKRW